MANQFEQNSIDPPIPNSPFNGKALHQSTARVASTEPMTRRRSKSAVGREWKTAFGRSMRAD
jgi:hypothetical protein